MMREEMTKSTVSDCRRLHRWRDYKRKIDEQGISHMLVMTTAKIIYKEFSEMRTDIREVGDVHSSDRG